MYRLCSAFLLIVALFSPTNSEAQHKEQQVLQIDLNNATAEELMMLPGVGPSRAAAIIRHRERRPFKQVREIMRIRGIGRKTFRKLRSQLVINKQAKTPRNSTPKVRDTVHR